MWPLLPKSTAWSSPIQYVHLELPYSGVWAMSNFTVDSQDIPETLVTLEHVAISVSSINLFVVMT